MMVIGAGRRIMNPPLDACCLLMASTRCSSCAIPRTPVSAPSVSQSGSFSAS